MRGFYSTFTAALLLCTGPLVAQTKTPPAPTAQTSKPAAAAPTLPAAPLEPGITSRGVRQVTASEHAVLEIAARVDNVTLVLLPEGEEILDVICGDCNEAAGHWRVEDVENTNIATVKPSAEGVRTSFHLVAKSGLTYSFVAVETSKDKAAIADIKVTVLPDPRSTKTPKQPQYVRVSAVESLQLELENAKATATALEATAARAAQRAESLDPSKRHHVYDYTQHQKPFLVDDMYHDGKFTYVKSGAREGFVIYETKDGEPASVNFEGPTDGLYIVKKVLGDGIFQVGNKRSGFARRHED